MDTGFVCRGGGGRIFKPCSHIFSAWCLIKQRGNFTFYSIVSVLVRIINRSSICQLRYASSLHLIAELQDFV
jgi:hypothetical protein